MKQFVGASLVFAAIWVSVCSNAVFAWPDRPIRLVVPYAAGGVGDISFRVLSLALEERIGQRFVLDNHPGASGNLGAAEVMRAVPDGYTLLLGAINNFATNQFLYRDMGFDPLSAFEPIALLSLAPNVVAITPGLPARNLSELVSYAQAHPNALNFGSPGIGTPPHLSAEFFATLAAVRMVHVPFNSTPQVMIALQQDSVQLSFYTLSPVFPLIRGGKLRPLAVAARERLAALPGTPTSAESGFPQLISSSWQAIVAPRGTDPQILDRLNRDIRTVLATPEAKARYAEMGMVGGDLGRAEFAAFMRSEAEHWRKVIQAAHIDPQ